MCAFKRVVTDKKYEATGLKNPLVLKVISAFRGIYIMPN